MAKLLDLTGQKFDKLLVLEQAPSRHRHTYWKCKCDCGNICEVSGEYLKRKNMKNRDCGCSKIKNIKKKEKEQRDNWLVGQRFGKLTVLRPTDQRKDKSIVWECLCDCGNIKYATSSTLRNGHTKSCGCLVREVQGIDIVGQRFGKLTVLNLCNYKKPNRPTLIWHCLCDCGNECDVDGSLLRRGMTKSCGCITTSIGELNIENILLINNIIYKKEYTFDDLISSSNRKYRYDFGLLDSNKNLIRLIEFDGEQHYSQRTGIWGKEETLEIIQKRDEEKNEYALSHNIPLVRIPYWERDNITLEMIMGDQYLVK